MRHTLNNFRTDVRNMTREEQIEKLNEIRVTLITETSKAKKGGEHSDIRLLRKEIAIIRTIMKEKGFHYNSR